MKTLFEYLVENPIDTEFEVQLGGRLAKAPPFKCKVITGEQYNSYVSLCFKSDKKGNNQMQIDKLNMLILKNHVIDPAFNNSKSLEAAGVATAEMLINKLLKGGEQSQLVNAILEESGYGNEVSQEEVDEVKNS